MSGWRRAHCIHPSRAATVPKDPDSVIVPFDTQAYNAKIDPSDSILSLSARLSKYGGGGTDCSIPLREANQRYSKRKFAGIVLVSDNESWINAGRPFSYGMRGSTDVMTQWDVQEDSAEERYCRSEADLHRHRPLRQHAGSGPSRHPEYRRLQ